MQISVINIPKMQKEIRDRHSKFMADYATYSAKAIADDQFLVYSAMAKINLITACLRSEMVIDRVDTQEKGSVKEIYLYKNGYNSYVRVVTNGRQIIMEGYGCNVGDFESDRLAHRNKIADINLDSYDWEKFAIELLEFIYTVIYEKAKAAEIRLDDALYGKGRPKKDTVVKKQKH